MGRTSISKISWPFICSKGGGFSSPKPSFAYSDVHLQDRMLQLSVKATENSKSFAHRPGSSHLDLAEKQLRFSPRVYLWPRNLGDYLKNHSSNAQLVLFCQQGSGGFVKDQSVMHLLHLSNKLSFANSIPHIGLAGGAATQTSGYSAIKVCPPSFQVPFLIQSSRYCPAMPEVN